MTGQDECQEQWLADFEKGQEKGKSGAQGNLSRS
jgi:hypothetical protein